MRKAAKGKEKSVIFPDTVFPTGLNEKILSYACGYDLPKKPLAFYEECAERTLRKANLLFDRRSFERWTDDLDCTPEINEAWRVKSLSEGFRTIKKLIAQIVQESIAAGALAEGFENLPNIVDHQTAVALEIGALGERILARKNVREEDVISGRTNLGSLQKGRDSNTLIAERELVPLKTHLQRFIDDNPAKTNYWIAKHALEEAPANLPRRGLRMLQVYVKKLRQKPPVRYTR